MSFADERKSIENRFKTEWTSTPIAFDNVPFNPPANSDWVRLNIQNGDSGYRSLESSIRHTGVINVQIFTPVNKATKTSRQYADIVSDIFSDQRFDDIVTDVSSINIIDDDDVWLQTNVTTPYYRDAEKIIVPVPVFKPLYVLLTDKLQINVDDPEIIMSGDVDVITPSRLEISGGISCTFNYVVGIAVYVDGVAVGHGVRESDCHEDVSFTHYDGSAIVNTGFMKSYSYNIATNVLGAGTHKIEIGILGKWLGNSHKIYVNDASVSHHPSSSTLLVKEFRAIPPPGGGGIAPETPDAVNIEIYSIEELEEHFGAGGTYSITQNVSITFMADIIIDGVFNIASGVNFIMQAKNHASTIIFNNTGTIFTHAGSGELRITQGKFTFSGNGATLFNAIVTNYINNWTSLLCTAPNIKLGSVTASSIFKIANSTIIGFANGYTISANLFVLNDALLQTTLATSNTVITFANTIGLRGVRDSAFVIGANENMFYIPQTNTAKFNIQGTSSSLNIGNFFESGSLTQVSKYINVENASTQIRSNTGTAMSVKDNTTSTTIETGWNPLNLGAVILGDLNSRFELVDATTGERKYEGLFPVKVGGFLSLSASRSGGAVAHSFRMIKTVDTKDDPLDDVEMQRDIGVTVEAISFPFSGTFYPGDQFRPEVMAVSGITPIMISSYSDIIQ
jgi:hypothetical protein